MFVSGLRAGCFPYCYVVIPRCPVLHRTHCSNDSLIRFSLYQRISVQKFPWLLNLWVNRPSVHNRTQRLNCFVEGYPSSDNRRGSFYRTGNKVRRPKYDPRMNA